MEWRHTWLICLVGGCAFSPVSQQKPQLPRNSRAEREQVVVYSDFTIPRQQSLLDELAELRTEVARTLALPLSDETVHVYLFESPKLYRGYVRRHFPQYPDRRACFIESETRLAVFAHWNDLIAIDLRHEVTHGYVHAVAPQIPLWLDEGLAEYFEASRSRRAVNPPHLYLLNTRGRGSWRPNLRKLEELTLPDEMGQLHYAEGWAWAHFLLETTPQRLTILQDYLARVRMTGEAPPLSQYLLESEPDIEQALLDHLQLLSRRMAAAD